MCSDDQTRLVEKSSNIPKRTKLQGHVETLEVMKSFFVGIAVAIPLPVVAAERPNIVFMLADDQGWSGLSVPMHPTIPSKGEEFSYSQP